MSPRNRKNSISGVALARWWFLKKSISRTPAPEDATNVSVVLQLLKLLINYFISSVAINVFSVCWLSNFSLRTHVGENSEKLSKKSDAGFGWMSQLMVECGNPLSTLSMVLVDNPVFRFTALGLFSYSSFFILDFGRNICFVLPNGAEVLEPALSSTMRMIIVAPWSLFLYCLKTKFFRNNGNGLAMVVSIKGLQLFYGSRPGEWFMVVTHRTFPLEF